MADSREVTRIREEYHGFYPILMIIIAVIIGISLGAWLFAGDTPILTGDLLHYVSNLWTEALSIGLTVIILDQVNQWRDRQRHKRDLRENLINEARSSNNTVATHAIKQLRDRDWLAGDEGVLQGANLESANLQGADFADANLQKAELSYANLQTTRLTFANLQETHLHETNLQQANLGYAELQKAQLYKANLQQADLIGSHMENANLMQADLRHADLEYANLQSAIIAYANLENASLEKSNLDGAVLVNAHLKNADFSGTLFSTTTALPDAEYTTRDAEGNMLFNKYWTPETDMSRYTNPEHPDFWQPDWTKSMQQEES